MVPIIKLAYVTRVALTYYIKIIST